MKDKKKKKVSKSKKGNRKLKFFLLFAIIFSIGYGQRTFADKDAESMLTSWFAREQTKSFQEMDQSINEEKAVLMAELRNSLGEGISTSDETLDNIATEEVEKSIAELRRYTEELKGRLVQGSGQVDTETNAIIDQIMNEAIQKMLAAAGRPTTPIPPVPVKPVDPTKPIEGNPIDPTPPPTTDTTPETPKEDGEEKEKPDELPIVTIPPKEN